MQPRRQPSSQDIPSATGRRHALRAAGAAGLGLLASLGLTRTSDAHQGKQGPRGPRGLRGLRGLRGPKGAPGGLILTSAPIERTATCPVAEGNSQTCAVGCETGELAVSGGFGASHRDIFAYGTDRVSTTGWGSPSGTALPPWLER